MLGDKRRTMKKLGAVRSKPGPTKDEDEAPYRKPNDGREKREGIPHEQAKPKPDVADQLVSAGAATPEQAKAARVTGKTADIIIVDDPHAPEPDAIKKAFEERLAPIEIGRASWRESVWRLV